MLFLNVFTFQTSILMFTFLLWKFTFAFYFFFQNFLSPEFSQRRTGSIQGRTTISYALLASPLWKSLFFRDARLQSSLPLWKSMFGLRWCVFFVYPVREILLKFNIFSTLWLVFPQGNAVYACNLTFSLKESRISSGLLSFSLTAAQELEWFETNEKVRLFMCED